jgi:hypothetical protein
MGKRISILIAVPLHALLWLTTACAMDTGSPIFLPGVPLEGKTELFYDRYDRKLRYKSAGDSPESAMELNLYGARLYFPAGVATVHLDAGGFEGRNRNAAGVFFGAGGSFLPVSIQKFDVYGTIAASYIPAMSYSETDSTTHKSYSEQFLEVTLGASVARDFLVKQNWHIIPQIGLLLSVVRGSGRVDTSSSENPDASGDDFTIEEDVFAVGSLGVSLVFRDQLSLRAEGRFIGEESLSLAFGYAF